MLCFLQNPDEFSKVQKAPQLLPLAIEEALRYRSPIQWTFRSTRKDVEHSGKTIPKGKLLLAVMGSANRDPAQFRDPDRFDVARDPNPHIAFGHGLHFCIGAPLARMEARIALTDLIARLKNLRLASNEPWEPRKALHVHGPSSLPVKFDL